MINFEEIDEYFNIRNRVCTSIIREAQDRMMQTMFIPRIMMWPSTRQSDIWYRTWVSRQATPKGRQTDGLS